MIHPEKKALVDQAACAQRCTCGGSHSVPDVLSYTGKDAFQVLAADGKSFLSGRQALVIDDENTHKAAGESVAEALSAAAVDCRVVTLPGDIHLTDDLAAGIKQRVHGSPLIIAVGSGTINDLGKYTAHQLRIPYWCVPTAPSMNGYTSSIAAVKAAGVKRTLPSAPPQAIYIQPAILRNAPLKLRQAGYCDVMAKSVSDVDWQIESLLFGDSYCALPSAIVAESEALYIERPEKIAAGEKEAVDALTRGLLISGMAMSLAGSSAPASGGEHLLSHFWDMRAELTGRVPEHHGLQVGAGIVVSAVCYEKLRDTDVHALRTGAYKRFMADTEGLQAIWRQFAPEVRQRFDLKKKLLLQFDELLPRRWPALAPLLASVPPAGVFLERIRRTGYPMTLSALNLTPDEFRLSACGARTIRERITILDLAAHAGVLESAAEDALELMMNE
ncbi:MAG: iron-containing alcohol dehydrogenase [Desulfobacterales bacterium]